MPGISLHRSSLGHGRSIIKSNKIAKFRNLNSATLNAVKGEKCHLDFGGRVQVFGEDTYLQDRFEKKEMMREN